MDRRDVEKIIENLQTKPFICSDERIEVHGGYVILQKEAYERLVSDKESGRKRK